MCGAFSDLLTQLFMMLLAILAFAEVHLLEQAFREGFDRATADNDKPLDAQGNREASGIR